MARGVRIFCAVEASGYGHAGIAYVRGLVNAGVPVHWIPLESEGTALRPMQADGWERTLERTAGDAALADLPALRACTQLPLDCEAVLVHTSPEHWGQFFETGRRNIGYTTWETDRLPPHWPPLLRQAHGVCVPSTQNQAIFSAEVPGLPVWTVPHIRRHQWNPADPEALEAFRRSLGIPASHFVFYSINTWDPRKNLAFLLQAFITAFSAADPVTLVLKTAPWGYGAAPFFARQPVAGMATAIVQAQSRAVGRPVPSICVLPYELHGRAIDMLHHIGDCYVSFSHGEGWGMGAFDAATLGRPVVMTGWGGQLDFLGTDWPGAVPYGLGAAPVWPAYRPSYWSSQRWACPDFDAAVDKLRQAFLDPDRSQRHALATQQRLVNQFAEPVVTQALLEALFVG